MSMNIILLSALHNANGKNVTPHKYFTNMMRVKWFFYSLEKIWTLMEKLQEKIIELYPYRFAQTISVTLDLILRITTC